MPAWEFFNDKPLQQIRQAIETVYLYLEDELGLFISPKEWEKQRGEQLHAAVNALLIYLNNLDMLPKDARSFAQEQLSLISLYSLKDLYTLQEELLTEALQNLPTDSPTYKR